MRPDCQDNKEDKSMAQNPEKTTVDPAEVEKFNALAALWWDAKGPFWPLHRLNILRIDYIKSKLCHHYGRDVAAIAPLSGLKVLDIGCGGGILSESMAALGAEVKGIDVVERNIEIARAHCDSQPFEVEYQCIRAEDIEQSGEQYDVVLNMEVVEHVADLSLFMRSANQLVREGGVHFIATINRNPLAWIVAIIGAEYILRWLPKGTHQYSKLVKPEELHSLLAADQLEIRDEVGVQVNPFNKQMAIVPFTGVNYMLYATK
ncbi:MAG TPA: bifunctional 3-demethylubiquinol 3-O-methyltransferase/2-polyprenyl-6-hydroxyphenol methylase [Gammaproteobacteria bacterium]|nr:bifunctional 3-demethylubiquinol 3-O-methyltransferase/2-polyprenyl-6-hydroxyphenol methylase [Gammaproteobacteria bacterium]